MALNVIIFKAREKVVARECQRERMSFKRDYAVVYDYKRYERVGFKSD